MQALRETAGDAALPANGFAACDALPAPQIGGPDRNHTQEEAE